MQDPRLWQADSAAAACLVCRRPFSFVRRRRHHCRRCGLVVCGDCSRQELWLQVPGASQAYGISPSRSTTSPAMSPASPLHRDIPHISASTEGASVQSPLVHLVRTSPTPTQQPTRESSTYANKATDAQHAEPWFPQGQPTLGHAGSVRASPSPVSAPTSPLPTSSGDILAAARASSLSGTSPQRQPRISRPGVEPVPKRLLTYAAYSSAIVYDELQNQYWCRGRVCDVCVRVFHDVLATTVCEHHTRQSLGPDDATDLRSRSPVPLDATAGLTPVLSIDGANASATQGMRAFLSGDDYSHKRREGSSTATDVHAGEEVRSGDGDLAHAPQRSLGFDRMEGGFTRRSWLFDVRREEDMPVALVSIAATRNAGGAATAAPGHHSLGSSSAWSLSPASREHGSSEETDLSASPTGSTHAFFLSSVGDGRDEPHVAAVVSRGGPACPPHRGSNRSLHGSSPGLPPQAAGAVRGARPTAEPSASTSRGTRRFLNPSLPLSAGLAPYLVAPLVLRAAAEAPHSDGTKPDAQPASATAAVREGGPCVAPLVCPAVPMLVAENAEHVAQLAQMALAPHKVCIIVVDERGVTTERPPLLRIPSDSGAEGDHQVLRESSAIQVMHDDPKRAGATPPRPARGSTDVSSGVLKYAEAFRTPRRSSTAFPGSQLPSASSSRQAVQRALSTLVDALRPHELPAALRDYLEPSTASPLATRTPHSAPTTRTRQTSSPMLHVSLGDAAGSKTRSGSFDAAYNLDGDSTGTVSSVSSPQMETSSETRGAVPPATRVPSFDPWSLTQQQQQQHGAGPRVATKPSPQSLNVSALSASDVFTPSNSAVWSVAAHSPTSPGPFSLAEGSPRTGDIITPVAVVLGTSALGEAGGVAVAAPSSLVAAFKGSSALGDLLLDLPVLVVDANASASTHSPPQAVPHSPVSVPKARTTIASRWQWQAVVAVSACESGSSGNGGVGGESRRREPSPTTGRTNSLVSTPLPCDGVSRVNPVGGGGARTSGHSNVVAAHARRLSTAGGGGLEGVSGGLLAGSLATTPQPTSVPVALSTVTRSPATAPSTPLARNQRVGTAVRMACSSGPTYMTALKQRLTLVAARMDGFVLLVLRHEDTTGTMTHSGAAAADTGRRVSAASTVASVSHAGSRAGPSLDSSLTSLESPQEDLSACHGGPAHGLPAVMSARRGSGSGTVEEDGHAGIFSGRELHDVHQHLLNITGKPAVAFSVVDVCGGSPAVAPAEAGGGACEGRKTFHPVPGSPLCSASAPPGSNAVTRPGAAATTCEAPVLSTSSAHAESSGLSRSTTASISPVITARSTADERQADSLPQPSSSPPFPLLSAGATSSTGTTRAARIAEAMEDLRLACEHTQVWYGRQSYTSSLFDHVAAHTHMPPATSEEDGETSHGAYLPLLGVALNAMATDVAIAQCERMTGRQWTNRSEKRGVNV